MGSVDIFPREGNTVYNDHSAIISVIDLSHVTSPVTDASCIMF